MWIHQNEFPSQTPALTAVLDLDTLAKGTTELLSHNTSRAVTAQQATDVSPAVHSQAVHLLWVSRERGPAGAGKARHLWLPSSIPS